MNIGEILTEIELKEDATERCINYAEIILYLKDLKDMIGFVEYKPNWKNAINKEIVKGSHREIDAQIEEVKNLMKLSINA